tara:strand:+ start:13822 stop:14298 length:477 start_codon:yes stop_codon:yes gene_type:complete
MRGFTAAVVPDQTGRTIFITGANAGLGFEAAKVLAGRGARVLIGCRSQSRASQAVADILTAHPDADIDIIALDLASLASIKRAAAAVEQEAQLDVLINDAEKRYNRVTRCAQSSLANLLFGYELQRRLSAVNDNTLSVMAHTRLWELSMDMTGIDPGI